jgi:hypothetical protein
MGYMGFGMKKSVYTRKPRKAFKKLKKILGTKLRPGEHISSAQLTDERKLELGNELRRERNTSRAKTAVALIAVVGLMLVIAYKFSSYWLV